MIDWLIAPLEVQMEQREKWTELKSLLNRDFDKECHRTGSPVTLLCACLGILGQGLESRPATSIRARRLRLDTAP
jgi:hypothetical protein